MSYSIRDRAQRKLKQANSNIDTAILYLAEITETYNNDHPEVSEPCTSVAKILMLAQEGIDNIRGLF